MAKKWVPVTLFWKTDAKQIAKDIKNGTLKHNKETDTWERYVDFDNNIDWNDSGSIADDLF